MQKYFEDSFKNYSERDGNSWGLNWRSSLLKRTELSIELMKPVLRSCKSILEIGCATGDMTVEIIRNAPNLEEYDAFDISKTAIEICKKKKIDKVNFYVEDITKMCTEKKYDLIICSDVIYYLNAYEQQECFRKVNLMLYEKGHLFIGIPFSNRNVRNVQKGGTIFCEVGRNYNFGWLWSKVEVPMYKTYMRNNNTLIKRITRSIIECKKISAFLYKINKMCFKEHYTHVFYLFKKKEKYN